MTTRTNINHRDHNHPNTTTARTACRLRLTAPKPVVENLTVGCGIAVHGSNDIGRPLCGAGVHGKVMNRIMLDVHTTASVVTCKNCIKLAS